MSSAGTSIHQLGAVGIGNGREIAKHRFDVGPEVEAPADKLLRRLACLDGVLLEDHRDELLQMLDVSLERREGERDLWIGELIFDRELQQRGRERDGAEGRPQIVGHEGQVFFASLLDFQCPLRRIGLHRQPDGGVEHAIEDVKRLAADVDAVFCREVVDRAAEDIVFGDDLGQVETVFEPLDAVGGRRAFEHHVRDRLVAALLECFGQLVEQLGNVVVERGAIEIASRRQLLDLPPPIVEQLVAFRYNKLAQTIKSYHAHAVPATKALSLKRSALQTRADWRVEQPGRWCERGI